MARSEMRDGARGKVTPPVVEPVNDLDDAERQFEILHPKTLRYDLVLRDANGNIVGAPPAPGSTIPGGKAGGSFSPGPATVGVGGVHPVHVVVNVSGSVIGAMGVHELAEIVSRAVYDNDRGIGKSGYVAAGRRLVGDGS